MRTNTQSSHTSSLFGRPGDPSLVTKEEHLFATWVRRDGFDLAPLGRQEGRGEREQEKTGAKASTFPEAETDQHHAGSADALGRWQPCPRRTESMKTSLERGTEHTCRAGNYQRSRQTKWHVTSNEMKGTRTHRRQWTVQSSRASRRTELGPRPLSRRCDSESVMTESSEPSGRFAPDQRERKGTQERGQGGKSRPGEEVRSSRASSP